MGRALRHMRHTINSVKTEHSTQLAQSTPPRLRERDAPAARSVRARQLGMDGTAEGLAAAAATREALKQRKACVQEAAEGAEGAKRGARPPPTCTHEVARPEGFEEESIDLEAGMYGEG